ncbi:hypothetical protein CEXT_364911 [Caerostris extrusa]|uniref:Uncharacterized protein n=1 Tax=Caerostris extrusa TaxID=172846 RepID=A0AAV4QSI0_CAEEX|nr:hypothetical protein CEXT_364911 [Caerostris extrusa]
MGLCFELRFRHAEWDTKFGALFQKKTLFRQGCGLNSIPIQQQYSYPIFQFCNDSKNGTIHFEQFMIPSYGFEKSMIPSYGFE